MTPFPSAKNLCNWAGICPGNNRSAGKSKHSRIKKGNRFLLTALVQAAWAAARKRDCIFQRKFHRWVRRLGEAKANVAIAHSLLELVYAMLISGQPYREPDPKQMHELERAKLVRHHAKRLRLLGADEVLVAEMVAQISNPTQEEEPALEEEIPSVPRQPIRRASPAKVCRGALGFRARQTRKQEYSVFTDPSTGGLSRARSKTQETTTPAPQIE